MAIAAFKAKSFADLQTLLAFIQTDVDVNRVIRVVTDNSGRYNLFYV